MKFKRAGLPGALAFLGWAFVFAVLYAQSPLYTSNQNQYFLHGLARAGYGYLSHDWLANTLDPTPVFSGLVWLTYAVFHSGLPFYACYALLMGVYLFSMYGVMDMLFDLRQSKTRTLVFLALFLAFHSAALRYLLSRLLDADTAFLFEGGVAGQRILGQVFQPSVFGVLLVLSIYLFLRGKTSWAILPLAAAVYFHPTYLLSGALLTLAYMWMLHRDRKQARDPLLFGLLTLAAVLPVVVYTFIVFGPTGAGVSRQAQEILVRFRIPNHALLSEWLDWTVAVQAGIVVAALVLLRRTRLFPVYVTLTLGAFLLTILQVITGSNALALLFPWRASVLLVPVGTSVLIASAVTKLTAGWKAPSRLEHLVSALSLALIAGLVLAGAVRFRIDATRQKSDPARAMMDYVAAHRSGQDLYLVPMRMDGFRLATGAPVFADFKSIPYLDREVLEWYRRVRLLDWFYNNLEPCKFLPDVTAEGVTRLVLETGSPAAACPSLAPVYQDNHYSIYSINP